MGSLYMNNLADRVLGPKGGQVDNPGYSPEARRASHEGLANMEDGVIPMHEFKDRAYMGLMREQPWHRMAAELMIAGLQNKQVARIAGVHKQEVTVLRSQRWFQELVATLCAETGQDIREVVKAEAMASLQKVVAIRDGESGAVDAHGSPIPVSPKTQLEAAKFLIEQAHGKAVQQVLSISHTSHTNLTEEYADLQKELSILRAQRETQPQ